MRTVPCYGVSYNKRDACVSLTIECWCDYLYVTQVPTFQFPTKSPTNTHVYKVRRPRFNVGQTLHTTLMHHFSCCDLTATAELWFVFTNNTSKLHSVNNVESLMWMSNHFGGQFWSALRQSRIPSNSCRCGCSGFS